MFDITPILNQPFRTFGTVKNDKREELRQKYLNLEKEKSKIYDPEELKQFQKKVDAAYSEYDKEDRKENDRLDKLLKEKLAMRK